LRPGNPEIDALAAEQLLKLVQRIIEDLQKPAARPEDFADAVKRVLQEAPGKRDVFYYPLMGSSS
jgi:hypothetical protein